MLGAGAAIMLAASVMMAGCGETGTAKESTSVDSGNIIVSSAETTQESNSRESQSEESKTEESTGESQTEESKTEESKSEEASKQESSQEEVETDENGIPKAYVPILDSCYNLLCYGVDNYESVEGLTGLEELVLWGTFQDYLSAVGYQIEDLSGDGVPELYIGERELGSAKDESSSPFVIYTIKDGKAVVSLEGWSRNYFAYLGNASFSNTGSNGAMYTVFGLYHLGKNGDLECDDFYFTYEKTEGNFEDIGIYHNTTGEYSKDQSELTEMTLEEYGLLMESYASKKQCMEIRPFYTYATESQIVDNSQPTGVKIQSIQYIEENVEFVNTYTMQENDYLTPVGFVFENPVQDFKVYSLELENVDEDGYIQFKKEVMGNYEKFDTSEALILNVTFPGSIPTVGISYIENGVERMFTLSLSGYDGSIIMTEIAQ